MGQARLDLTNPFKTETNKLKNYKFTPARLYPHLTRQPI